MNRRLDQEVVARGLAPTRAKARDAILRGHVTVDGRSVARPAATVGTDNRIALSDPAAGYVSRAALKLLRALDHFGYDPSGRLALDLGASTGGFTQVLLQRGATRVVCVDVGYGQLDPSLAANPNVMSLEGVNARDLTGDKVGGAPAAIVSDVSFISQRLALPPALGLTAPGCFAVILVKPQFEVGRGGLGKDGVVKDPAAGAEAAEAFARWFAERQGWRVDGLIPSPIHGGAGNPEYLLGARKASA